LFSAIFAWKPNGILELEGTLGGLIGIIRLWRVDLMIYRYIQIW